MAEPVGFRQTEILAELASERIIWLDLRRQMGHLVVGDGVQAEYTYSNDNMDDLLDLYAVSLGAEDGS